VAGRRARRSEPEAVSAVVAGISVAAKNSSPLGSYLDFADAFVLTLPLSIGIAFTVWFAPGRTLEVPRRSVRKVQARA
jgi:predicted MFS family arabinose efflux permease